MTGLVSIARRLFLGQLVAIGILGLLHVIVVWAGPHAFHPQLVELVHVDKEGNLPTWFSISQLSLLTLVLLATGIVETRFRPDWSARAWFVFAGGALFLSADEAALLHERVARNLQGLASVSGPGTFYHRLRDLPFDHWIVVYAPAALVVGPLVIVFLWRRLGQARLRASVAIVAYAGAAIGLDVVESLLGGPDRVRPVWADLALVEEMVEMCSVAVLIGALFEHLRERIPGRVDPVS